MTSERPIVAIIGGTGDLGSGLARRWADAGYSVVIGSRSRDKAEAMARDMQADGRNVRGADNAGAAREAAIVVLSVPFASHNATLMEIKAELGDKILVNAVVPLVPPKVATAQPPPEGSAAQIAAAILGEGTRVVSAFHNVGASKLHSGEPIDCDVLVFGDSKAARDRVIALIHDIGLRGVDGGVLANSIAAETLTSVLIGINRRYKVEGAGIRITGLPEPQG
jgi:NADPH-dependent F420 reductase